jgi:Glutamyl-tRNAGlu reductase, N-terminal domain
MEPAKMFHLLGASFHTAPAAVREAWHFRAPDALALLRRAADALPGWEAAVLSTCNRTEFYLAVPERTPVLTGWLALLRAPGAARRPWGTGAGGMRGKTRRPHATSSGWSAAWARPSWATYKS